MLGWKILPEGEYKINLPILTKEEEEIIILMEDRFRDLLRITEFKNDEEIKGVLRDILKRVCEENSLYVDADQEKYLVEVAYRHMYGLLFFDDLLRDEEIEEISMISLGKPVFVYLRKKGWVMTNAMIYDENLLIDIINKMAKSIGRRITYQNPRLDATLPDGSRLHASIPPISEGEITIRKFRDRPFSPREIEKFGTLNVEMLSLLSLFMQSDSSVIIAGNTASGKTTTLNAIFSFVPMNERILITEETPEINIPHYHQVRLVSNKEMGITLMDLIYDSLRMRPDRVIVGEVRNAEETQALMDAILGGQARGAYATFHAQSAHEALKRIKSMGIPEMDLNSIDLIYIQRRMLLYDKEKKMNAEVRKGTELAIVENSKPRVVFKLNPSTGSWVLDEKELDRALEIVSEKIGLTLKEGKEVFKERKKIISDAPLEYGEFFNYIQERFYSLKKG